MQFEKTVLHLLRRVRGNKSPFTLTAHHQVFSRQFVDRFAHRTLTHLETPGQLHFAGNQFPWAPLTCLQALQYQAFDLLVKRTKRRSKRCSGIRASSAIR